MRWVFFVLIVTAFIPATASQDLRAEIVEAEALLGRPFGVGRVTVRMREPAPKNPWEDGRLDLVERNGRVLYPAFDMRPVRDFINEFLGEGGVRNGGGTVVPDRIGGFLPRGGRRLNNRPRLGGLIGAINGIANRDPNDLTIWFLFRGDEPLELTVHAPQPQSIRLRPIHEDRDDFEDTLEDWWEEYTRATERRGKLRDYSPVVDVYLTSMLARRLRLQPPEPKKPFLLGAEDFDQALAPILGTESLHLRTVRSAFFDDRISEEATLPLPDPIKRPAPIPLPVPEGVTIEPMAMHVPVECFYLRLGNFENYVWMRRLIEQWGGLAGMLLQSGLDYNTDIRLERRLGLKETELIRVLGGAVIDDVAIIGTDTFFREGPAIGLLFQTNNSEVLSASIDQQRGEALAAARNAGREADEKKFRYHNQVVSFISSSDGRLRSFYARDGDYHLVTTSRFIARRFLQAGEGDRPLGDSLAFRHTRAQIPADRGDTLFAYLSEDFFRNLASPAYRIEMNRRRRAAVDIEIVEAARLAAKAEGTPTESLEDLAELRLIPQGTLHRPDGSRPVAAAEGFVDSRRGPRGDFTPIPDIKVENVSRREAADYRRFAESYDGLWTQIDPLILTIRRQPGDKLGRENLKIELQSAPLRPESYARLASFFGPPLSKRIVPFESDLVRAEGMMGNGNYLYLGIEDVNLPQDGELSLLRFMVPDARRVRGYLGGTPSLGGLHRLIGGRRAPRDAHGYSRLLFGIWQREWNGFTTLSMHPEVLQRVTPQLRFVETDRPAQARLEIVDLSHSRAAEGLNAFGYKLAGKVSLGNTQFMHVLARQLRVPREQCLEMGQHLVGASFSCPLGGKYQLEEGSERRLPLWVSTAWSGANRRWLNEVPPGYVFPAMQWFRGAEAELLLEEGTLSVRADVRMQQKEFADDPSQGSLPLQPPSDAPAPTPPAEELPPPAGT